MSGPENLIPGLSSSPRPDLLSMRSATLPPEARLHSPSEFAAALKGRRVGRGALFILSAVPAAEPGEPRCARLGLIIAKRFAARAATRNAIKRVARESFRAARLDLPPLDYVLRLNAKVAATSLTVLKKTVRAEIDAHFRKAVR